MASKVNYGLTIKLLRTMAYDFGVKEKVAIPTTWHESKMAGADWYYGFLKRHEQIRTQRAKGFNKTSVDAFYATLGQLYNDLKITRDRLWNMDETGFPTVTHKVQKILAEKGTKRVGIMSSAERGTNVTCAAAVSAAGDVIPPFFIFPRTNMQSRFMDGCDNECVGCANESGYMKETEFIKFIHHFVKYSHATKENPSLLLIDNHTSHLSFNALETAVNHGITIFSFPPHCTHKLQPLDNGVFLPVKTGFVVEHDEWMKSYVGKKFEIYHVAPIVEKCFDEFVTKSVIKTAFTVTGVYELNTTLFKDVDFAAAKLIAGAATRAEHPEGEEINIENEHVVLVSEADIEVVSFEEVASMSR